MRMFAHRTWTAAKEESLWGTPDHRLHKHTDNTDQWFNHFKNLIHVPKEVNVTANPSK